MLVNGYRVTTPARTVVDIARTRSFEDALVVADHALRLGRATRAQLQAVVDRAPLRRGMRAARQVILFADGRAASAGESRSRLLIARELLPVPELQLAIRGRTGWCAPTATSGGRSTARSAQVGRACEAAIQHGRTGRQAIR